MRKVSATDGRQVILSTFYHCRQIDRTKLMSTKFGNQFSGSVDISGRPYEIQQGQNVCRPVRDGFRMNLFVDTTLRSAQGREEQLSLFQGEPQRDTKGTQRRQQPGHPQGVPLRLGWLAETSTSPSHPVRGQRPGTARVVWHCSLVSLFQLSTTVV